MSKSRILAAAKRISLAWVVVFASLALAVVPSSKAAIGPIVEIVFDTELLALSLGGGPFPMPLGPGYDTVASLLAVTLSSGERSLGQAIARNSVDEAITVLNGNEPIDPDALDGQQFFVQSFFDVFFDITLTDVDTAKDYAGQAPGAILVMPDNGPANMQSFHSAVFDKDAPNFGLIPPPESAPYIGHFQIEIPLGGDINGNGEDDMIKFTLATHAVGDENRTFIILPDGTVIDNFDSTASLEGAVVDLSTDPPFGPFTLTGPTSASSKLQNPIATPDGGATWLLLGVSSLGLLVAGGGWVRAIDPRKANAAVAPWRS